MGKTQQVLIFLEFLVLQERDNSLKRKTTTNFSEQVPIYVLIYKTTEMVNVF